MEATAPSGVGGSKAASARKAGLAAGADDLDISDDVPLFAFDASNTETLSGGRPKRKLKAIARFESMSWAGSSVHCKVGEGFACPQCAATCSYDAKECTECQLPCYYEAGIGVLVMKEREIDQSRQHLVQKRAPRRKRQKAKASPKIAVGEVGYTFLKKFDDGWYEGRVVKVRPGAREGKDRRCVYSDGDSEDLSMEQLRALLLLERNRPKSVDDQFIEYEPEVVEVPHFSSERTTRSQVPILPKNEPEDILNGHVNCPECFRGTLWRKGCKTVHCQNSHLHKCGGWVYFCFFCKERCERGTDFVNCECQWRNTSENRKEVYAQRRLPIDLCRLGDDGEATRVSDSSEGAPNPSPEADALPEDLDEEASHQQVSRDRSVGVGRELADEEDGSFSVDVGDERKLPPRKVIVKREEAETDEESFHQFNAPSKPIEVKTEDAGVKEKDTDTESSNSKGASGEHRPVGAGEKTRSATQKKPAQKKSRVGGGETTAKNSTPHARPRRDVTNDRKWNEYFELLTIVPT